MGVLEKHENDFFFLSVQCQPEVPRPVGPRSRAEPNLPRASVSLSAKWGDLVPPSWDDAQIEPS